MPDSSLHLITGYKQLPSFFERGAVFCAFDTETTGLSSKKDRIIEIGAIKFSKDGILGTFSSLVNPLFPLPQIITNITGITDGMLENERKEGEVIPEFIDFIEDSILIAHNAQFDLKFTNVSLERVNLPSLKNLAVDTLRMSRTFLPDNEHWTLQYLAKQFEINVESAHRAYDDARVCMNLYLKLLEKVPKKKTSLTSEFFKTRESPR